MKTNHTDSGALGPGTWDMKDTIDLSLPGACTICKNCKANSKCAWDACSPPGRLYSVYKAGCKAWPGKGKCGGNAFSKDGNYYTCSDDNRDCRGSETGQKCQRKLPGLCRNDLTDVLGITDGKIPSAFKDLTKIYETLNLDKKVKEITPTSSTTQKICKYENSICKDNDAYGIIRDFVDGGKKEQVPNNLPYGGEVSSEDMDSCTFQYCSTLLPLDEGVCKIDPSTNKPMSKCSRLGGSEDKWCQKWWEGLEKRQDGGEGVAIQEAFMTTFCKENAAYYQFDASDVNVVNIDDDTITITDDSESFYNKISTGYAVNYYTQANANAEIGGLNDKFTYYIIKLDDNKIAFAATPSKAEENKRIELTQIGSGSQLLNGSPPECDCVNRSSDHIYKILAAAGTGQNMSDGCWWPECKDTKTYLVPNDLRKPSCPKNVCQNIVFAQDAGNNISITDLEQSINCNFQKDCVKGQSYSVYRNGESPCYDCSTCTEDQTEYEKCNLNSDTVCKNNEGTCPNGEYSLLKDFSDCTPCTDCNDGEIIETQCNPKSDTVCSIKPPMPTPEPEPSNGSTKNILFWSSIAAFIIIIIIIIYFFYIK